MSHDNIYDMSVEDIFYDMGLWDARAGVKKLMKEADPAKREVLLEAIKVIEKAMLEKARHIDHLIRHKCPDDKPKKSGVYLTRVLYEAATVPDEPPYEVSFEDLEWDGEKWVTWNRDAITHWWHEPEIKQ